MALAAECYVPQLGCEALFPVSGARIPHHQSNISPHLPTSSIIPSTSSTLNKEYAVPKDYSIPLHVDCSVEYDLPDCAKPPQGVKIEPLLMIHPAHFRRLDSLRRCPFVNNLPSANNNCNSIKTNSRNNYELLSNNNNAVINSNNCKNSSCQYPQVLSNHLNNKMSVRNVTTRSQSKIKESPNISSNKNVINNTTTTTTEHSNNILNNSNTNNNNKRWTTNNSNASAATSHLLKNQQCCNITDTIMNTKGSSNNINNNLQYGLIIPPASNQVNNNLTLQPTSNNNLQQYRIADVPSYPYSSTACFGGPSILPFAPKEGDTLENSTFGKYPTLETSTFGKYPTKYTSNINNNSSKSSRLHRSYHPYAAMDSSSTANCFSTTTSIPTIAAAVNCDSIVRKNKTTSSTLNMLQGNLITSNNVILNTPTANNYVNINNNKSPFHAKMFNNGVVECSSNNNLYQNSYHPLIMYK